MQPDEKVSSSTGSLIVRLLKFYMETLHMAPVFSAIASLFTLIVTVIGWSAVYWKQKKLEELKGEIQKMFLSTARVIRICIIVEGKSLMESTKKLT
jgi:hypothetical protein